MGPESFPIHEWLKFMVLHVPIEPKLGPYFWKMFNPKKKNGSGQHPPKKRGQHWVLGIGEYHPKN